MSSEVIANLKANALGWLVALGAHVLLAGVALGQQRASPQPSPPLEVELAEREPPAPPPERAAEQPTPELPSPERVPAARAVAAPPAPARAAALLTAKADPEPSAHATEPVDFTNDPSVLGFGSGTVVVGGKAEHGVAAARPSPVAGTASGGAGPGSVADALTPVSNLSRKPSLNESDPCRGYFPSRASEDVASAAVLVTLAKSGAVSAVELLSESPAGQGFGAAARTCMAGKRFSPGLDHDGNPVRTRIRVNVRFER